DVARVAGARAAGARAAARTEVVVPVRAGLDVGGGYHSPQVEVDVRLNTNESPVPPPPGWLDALRDALGSLDLHRYPDRRASALRCALADVHGVAPEQVFCANGSNEVLQCLLLAYGGAGRTVVTFEPTYALHTHIARITGTGVAAGERRPDFTLDLDEARRLLASARPTVTFLCSPNNPTGLADPPEVIREVVARAPGLVVVDEAYGQFSPWSALTLLGEGGGEASRRLAVVRTFSKTWAMAGARLGYLVAPEPVVAAVEAVVLPYHLDAVKQLAGRLALSFGAEMQDRVAMLVGERARLAAGLQRLRVETWPSDANFILFRPLAREGREVWQGLLDRSVLVRDCSSWPRLAGCLRVTVGTPAEDDRFLVALAEVLEGPAR
ncbi:MAG: histidinol-phosphate transaminase, partial [Acidimicrobiales bacterium]